MVRESRVERKDLAKLSSVIASVNECDSWEDLVYLLA